MPSVCHRLEKERFLHALEGLRFQPLPRPSTSQYQENQDITFLKLTFNSRLAAWRGVSPSSTLPPKEHIDNWHYIGFPGKASYQNRYIYTPRSSTSIPNLNLENDTYLSFPKPLFFKPKSTFESPSRIDHKASLRPWRLMGSDSHCSCPLWTRSYNALSSIMPSNHCRHPIWNE